MIFNLEEDKKLTNEIIKGWSCVFQVKSSDGWSNLDILMSFLPQNGCFIEKVFFSLIFMRRRKQQVENALFELLCDE